MKKSVRIIAIILTLITIVMALASCELFVPKDLHFQLSDDGEYYILMDLGAGKIKNLSVPAKYKGKPVGEISYGALCDNDYIESITIPDGVELKTLSIEDCKNLKKIKINASVVMVSIHNCENLEKLKLGADVSGISISKCKNLTSASVALSNKDLSSRRNAIYDKEKTKLFFVPKDVKGKFKVPATVQHIFGGSFSDCTQLKEVVLPDGLISLRASTFVGCSSLEKIVIPSSVTSLDSYAFYGANNLSSIEVEEGNEGFFSEGGVLYRKWNGDLSSAILFVPRTMSGELVCSKKISTIDYIAFEGCDKITKIVLPETLKELQPGRFRNCTSLEEITISGKTKIRAHAFENMPSLKVVNFLGTKEQFEAANDAGWNIGCANIVVKCFGATLDKNGKIIE